MTASFILTLDTTGPQGVAASINAGATYATSRDVSLAATSTDSDPVEVKIYGDVDASYNADIQPLEADSNWITLASPHAVRLSTGDGSKTLKLKLRDDVGNVSAEATDSITLDLTAPIPAVSAGPTPSKISKISGHNSSDFTWSPDTDIQAYKVKVVPSSSSVHTAGTQIPTTAGSVHMSGGAVSASVPVTSTIKGTDLETAGAEGDNRVKVFVQDLAGNWSVAA